MRDGEYIPIKRNIWKMLNTTGAMDQSARLNGSFALRKPLRKLKVPNSKKLFSLAI